eukprot:Gb_35819 [translate_table: standard]
MLNLTGHAYTWDKQLDKGYEEYDEDSDEECDLECENNIYDKDIEEEREDKDEEDQTEEGYPKLEPSDQPENPVEHKEGEEDHVIHVDDSDNGEIDQEENFYDEEDYDPGSCKGTINKKVWDPFPIIPQTQYSSYHDSDKEDMDKNGDCNKDYVESDKNPNKEEVPKHKVFSKEYYSDKNLEYEGHKEGDDSEYKELDKEPDIGDNEGFSLDNKDETVRMFILVEVDPAYEETSPEGRGNGLDQQTKELGSDDNTKDDSMTSTKEDIISKRFGKSKMQVGPGGFQKR